MKDPPSSLSSPAVTETIRKLSLLPDELLIPLLSPSSPSSSSSLRTLLLRSLLNEIPNSLLTSHSISYSKERRKERKELHSLVTRYLSLSSPPPTTTKNDIVFLSAYAAAFIHSNSSLVSRTIADLKGIEEVIETDGPGLLLDGVRDLVDRLRRASKGKGKLTGKEEGKGIGKKILLLTSLPQAVPWSIARHYAVTPRLLESLSELYDVLSFSKEEGEEGRLGEEEAERLLAKIEILELAQHLLSSFSNSNSGSVTQSKAFGKVIGELLKSTAAVREGTPLMDQGLVEDLEWYYDFLQNFEVILDRLPEDVKRKLRGLRESTQDRKRRSIKDGLEILRSFLQTQSTNSPDDEEIDSLSIATTQILDLFPTLPIQFIRTALKHPKFFSSSDSSSTEEEGAVERLIAALLEGEDLPADLEVLRNAPLVAGSGEVEDVEERKEEVVVERRNVFDDQKLDRGALLRKDKVNPSSVSLPPSLLSEELKARIIIRAEAVSSDEESEEDERTTDGRRRRTEAFLESDDEEEEGGGAREGRVGVRDTGQEEVEEPIAEKPIQIHANALPILSDPFTPTIRTVLELAYLADPKVFDRDGVTRRSEQRRKLRDETKLGDEQIEGWRSMLDRNPKKEKILRRHDALYSANTNRLPLEEEGSADMSRQSSNDSQGRGRGRGGGDRGGRGRGDGRGRGRGDGGRAQSDRRQRGRDRKTARGGYA